MKRFGGMLLLYLLLSPASAGEFNLAGTIADGEGDTKLYRGMYDPGRRVSGYDYVDLTKLEYVIDVPSNAVNITIEVLGDISRSNGADYFVRFAAESDFPPKSDADKNWTMVDFSFGFLEYNLSKSSATYSYFNQSFDEEGVEDIFEIIQSDPELEGNFSILGNQIEIGFVFPEEFPLYHFANDELMKLISVTASTLTEEGGVSDSILFESKQNARIWGLPFPVVYPVIGILALLHRNKKVKLNER